MNTKICWNSMRLRMLSWKRTGGHAVAAVLIGLSLASVAQADGVIDFAQEASSSEWWEGVGDGQWIGPLRFPHRSKAKAMILNRTMEDGERSEILYTHPKWFPDGRILGLFRDTLVPSAGEFPRFRASVGLVKGARRSDGVTFEVRVMPEGWSHDDDSFYNLRAGTVIASVEETYDGELTEIDVSLAAFAGQRVTFIFHVYAGGNSARDWAGWVNPRIEVSDSRADLRNFGWGSIKVGGELAEGDRPLLIAVLNYDKRKDSDGRWVAAPQIPSSEVAAFRQMMSPTSTFNFGSYFDRNSNGRFRFKPAVFSGDGNTSGVYYISVNGKIPSSSNTARVRKALVDDAIKAIESTGARFGQFDRNGDGKVTPNELTLAIISNGSAGVNENAAIVRSVESGRARPYRLHSGGGYRVRYQGSTIFAGYKVGYDVMLHELMHTLGLPDLYATSDGSGAFPEGCLAGTTILAMGASHLDPIYKMALGWVFPRIVTREDLRDYSRSFSKEMRLEPSTGDTSSLYGDRPVLLADNLEGSEDFYMIEYRRRDTPDDHLLFPNMIGSLAAGSCSITGANCVDGLARAMCSPGESCVASPSGGVLVWQARRDSRGNIVNRGVANVYQTADRARYGDPYWLPRNTGAGASFSELDFDQPRDLPVNLEVIGVYAPWDFAKIAIAPMY